MAVCTDSRSGLLVFHPEELFGPKRENSAHRGVQRVLLQQSQRLRTLLLHGLRCSLPAVSLLFKGTCLCVSCFILMIERSLLRFTRRMKTGPVLSSPPAWTSNPSSASRAPRRRSQWSNTPPVLKRCVCIDWLLGWMDGSGHVTGQIQTYIYT